MSVSRAAWSALLFQLGLLSNELAGPGRRRRKSLSFLCPGMYIPGDHCIIYPYPGELRLVAHGIRNPVFTTAGPTTWSPHVVGLSLLYACPLLMSWRMGFGDC